MGNTKSVAQSKRKALYIRDIDPELMRRIKIEAAVNSRDIADFVPMMLGEWLDRFGSEVKSAKENKR